MAERARRRRPSAAPDGLPAGAEPLPAGADVFAAGGDVGRALAQVDWAATPLGPPQTWPQSLQSVVRVLLTSRFSMWMAWGPELTFLCNDTYRRDTLAGKYPWALGRPAGEVWREIWPDIGPRIAHVMTTGEATWDEALLLFLERKGFREETYHTFSYSPLTDDDGAIVGMLCVVSEDTPRVIGAARMSLVRDLGAAVTALRSESEVLDAAARQLSAGVGALPFTLTYLLDEATGTAVQAASSGLPDGAAAARPVLDPAGASPAGTGPAPWPLEEVLQGRTALVDRLGERFDDLPGGAWGEPPKQALLVPFRQQDQVQPLGFLVAALSPFQVYDDDYRGFVELVAGQVGAALASARAYQDERGRAERLLELDRAKTAFFTNVSHEFRTPLTLMLGPTEDALADTAAPLAPAQRERVEIVRRNGERLLRLVNTLLDFSRLESGTLHAAYEPVDLAAYTAELADAFRVAVERVGLEFSVSCPALAEPVYVDREMWAKVVLNLLSNALKFTFEGGIAVRLSAGDHGVQLVVEDTGTGIAKEQQAGLFERFTRVAGAESRSYEGSGIGLALVADLAAAHGGTVAVDSEPGRGSAFTVTVPLGRGHLPPEQVVERAAPAASAGVLRSARGFLAEAMRWLVDTGPQVTGPTGDGALPRVLVVDDNADMREYMTRLLSGEYDVLAAADGRAGLELARRAAPDLVLSDVMMPRLSGVGLLQALRDDPLTAQIPVVLVSARAGEDATVEGLDAGADDYLAKPFSGRELLARVRANLELERGRRTRRALERSGKLLDQAERLAGVGSWEIDLASGAITASTEFVRQIQLTDEELRGNGFELALTTRVHPDDRERVRAALDAAVAGAALDYELRLVLPDGQTRRFRTVGELDRDDEGRPVRLRGSHQDVTEQREAERAVAAAAAAEQAAAREHSIAEELQRSLLPAADVTAEELRIAAYYRAGAEGTQVGGDWYDVIELGAGRTALVLGDVMGRGVRAAAVMGQLRSAVRAFARLDLPPADVLEHLDGVVRELGDDQIVTCVYAVYDPYDGRLTYANAGHLPPLVRSPDGRLDRLQDADGAPLGTAAGSVTEQSLDLEPGSLLVLYTDGLVEDRSSNIEVGIGQLGALVAELPDEVDRDTPGGLVAALLPQGSDDDIALLLAQVERGQRPPTATLALVGGAEGVPDLRHRADQSLRTWGLRPDLRDDVLLVLTELATNALLHGRAPVAVRLRRGAASLSLEVHDAATVLPRRQQATDDDEHGRGLLLVSLLADRWGTRPTPAGKAVWCGFTLPGSTGD
ncbi:MAG TPA: SpoIIE family protein phosphatase [Mycobacteriales bacterium]|nr:SpoIIE family protein phosphatase [Mycobacteriales bacterium]